VRERLDSLGLPPELTLHCNGNNLALTVRGAQKHDAVRRVTAELEQEGPLVTIGAGDSLTDLPFMRICDFALTPRDSQIQRETWRQSLQSKRAQILTIAARHGARKVRVFGSVARGTARPSSDIDFLVKMEEGRSLLTMRH